MACPTCDHTMSCVAPGTFWCERCGTLRIRKTLAAPNEDYTPHLVGHCRHFERIVENIDSPLPRAEWHRLSIAESINTPENRPSLEE